MLKRIDDKNPDEYVTFTSMYTSYCNELLQFGGPSDPVTGMEVKAIFRNKEILPYWILENGMYIGFILLGYQDNKHPLSDWFIGEFYVRPDYRRLHYGESAVKELMKNHQGKYCLFILNSNTKAKSFWKETFKKAGYLEESRLFSSVLAPPNSSFYFFSPIDQAVLQ